MKDIVFKCQRCGACCQKFGHGSRNYLPLYDWEVKDFHETAKKQNLKLDIRPVSVFYDSNTKEFFCVIYGLFNPPCPFYSSSVGCTIYENRPFVCRTFPLFWIPSTVPDRIFGEHCFGYCNSFDHYLFLQSLTKKPLAKKGISRRVHSCYGECYDFCLKSNKINLLITKLLRDLENKNIISLTKIDTHSSELNTLPFFDFLLKHKIFSEKRISNLIQRFKQMKLSSR